MQTYDQSADLRLLDDTLRPLFRAPGSLPVRYRIGNVLYRGMPEDAKQETGETDRGRETIWTATVRGFLLRAEVTEYRDFGAVEWKLTLTNAGKRALRVSDLFAADLTFPGQDGTILLCNGDFCSPDGYETSEHRLAAGETLVQAPEGGRGCDRAFPYQRVLFSGYGFHVAVGWPGQWETRYTGTDAGLAFLAGQQIFRSSVRPGESVRTPLMAVVAFSGSLPRGINVWRRWYLRHVMPHPHGAPVKPFLHGCYQVPGSVEFSEATEENQKEAIRKIRDCGIDLNLWWIDAGWYPCRRLANGKVSWWSSVGEWKCDRTRFPNGLGPVSDAAREAGMDFLLWFEPERVMPDSPVALEHPDWLIRCEDDRHILLNLGIPACRDYLTRTVGDAIEANGVTVYRQDFNIAPLCGWKRQDGRHRRGMTENRYVQGYLTYLDGLRMRFPDLVIDNCAAGGRRNDLEDMRRAVPFHQTDSSYGNHPVQQAFCQTLYGWIPYFRGFNESWETADGSYENPGFQFTGRVTIDRFQLFSSFAPILSFAPLIRHFDSYTSEDLDLLKTAARLFYRIAPILETADFYALTPYHKSRFCWTCWQFDQPEKHSGLLEVIRNNAAPDDTLTVFAQALESARYRFTNPETGESFEEDGDKIAARGLSFSQPVRSVAFWEYEKL